MITTAPNRMIVVTGANGQLGRAITLGLLERIPATQIAVSVRDATGAEALGERGVRVREASFQDGAQLRVAFEGAKQVLIVSSNTSGANAVEAHRTAIEAAVAVGAQRILYTSHMGSSPESLFAPMRDHAATEELLKASGVAFTSLRNGFYAASALQVMGGAFATGELRTPQDGPTSWTAHADLAAAAVIALTEPGRLDGITPPLTASVALDFGELAALSSELGRPMRRSIITESEYAAALVGHGVPAWRAELLLGMFRASHRGEFAAVDPTLSRLLGRPPVGIREIMSTR